MLKSIFKKRYAFILLILAGIPVMFLVPSIIPILQLRPEEVGVLIGNFPQPIGELQLTNSLIVTAFVDVLLIVLGLYLWRANRRMTRAVKSEDKAPKGFYNLMEALFEFFFNQAEDLAGSRWSSFVFPVSMTIILMVAISNWTELIPGVDSVGILEPSPTGEGYASVKITNQIGPIPPIYYLDRKTPQTVEPGEVHHGEICEEACAVLPVLRAPSTDLNFTLSLALMSVIMTQVIGFRAQGFRYLGKFFVFGTLFTDPLGFMDMFVGALELISEFVKILSFSFRLLGNIFAGTILLFVVSFFLPPFAPWIIAFLELFVGAIQAYVFGMLTMTFMSSATVHHGAGAEQH